MAQIRADTHFGYGNGGAIEYFRLKTAAPYHFRQPVAQQFTNTQLALAAVVCRQLLPALCLPAGRKVSPPATGGFQPPHNIQSHRRLSNR